mgnify:CR=1 FL=1
MTSCIAHEMSTADLSQKIPTFLRFRLLPLVNQSVTAPLLDSFDSLDITQDLFRDHLFPGNRRHLDGRMLRNSPHNIQILFLQLTEDWSGL